MKLTECEVSVNCHCAGANEREGNTTFIFFLFSLLEVFVIFFITHKNVHKCITDL